MTCTIPLEKEKTTWQPKPFPQFHKTVKYEITVYQFFLLHCFVHHYYIHAEPLYLLSEQERHKGDSEEIQWDGSHKRVNCPKGDEMPLIAWHKVPQPEIVILC